LTYSGIREASKEPALTWDESEKMPKQGIFQIKSFKSTGINAGIFIRGDSSTCFRLTPSFLPLALAAFFWKDPSVERVRNKNAGRARSKQSFPTDIILEPLSR
jgi:hypothetical protein